MTGERAFAIISVVIATFVVVAAFEARFGLVANAVGGFWPTVDFRPTNCEYDCQFGYANLLAQRGIAASTFGATALGLFTLIVATVSLWYVRGSLEAARADTKVNNRPYLVIVGAKLGTEDENGVSLPPSRLRPEISIANSGSRPAVDVTIHVWISLFQRADEVSASNSLGSVYFPFRLGDIAGGVTEEFSRPRTRELTNAMGIPVAVGSGQKLRLHAIIYYVDLFGDFHRSTAGFDLSYAQLENGRTMDRKHWEPSLDEIEQAMASRATLVRKSSPL